MRRLRYRKLLVHSLAPLNSRTPPGSLGATLPLFAAAVLALTLLSGRGAAQESGMLRGIVTTVDKKPLPQARISVVGTALGALTNADGSFRISALPLGTQSLEVKLLGYVSLIVPVVIEDGRDASVQVALIAIPVPLAAVKVTADTLILPEMRRFAERRSRGSGRFFTREEIDKMEARSFTDILRRVPGMQLELSEGSFGPTVTVQTSRNQGVSGGRLCPVLFYLNGVPLTNVSDMAINHFVAPGDVAAVEVYSGASQIPPEFNSSMYNARCGVVVIWSRISTSPSRSN